MKANTLEKVHTGEILAANERSATGMENLLFHGDLSKLTPEQRVAYYNAVCQSVGLNPLTQPFSYIVLNGKLTLYAKKDCTDQLRAIHEVSIKIAERQVTNEYCAVTARAFLKDGRHDESIGVVSVQGLKGEAYANALMKAETKSKRRVTLSICGLGWLDETEASSIADAQYVNVDMETGEIKSPLPPTHSQPDLKADNVALAKWFKQDLKGTGAQLKAIKDALGSDEAMYAHLRDARFQGVENPQLIVDHAVENQVQDAEVDDPFAEATV